MILEEFISKYSEAEDESQAIAFIGKMVENKYISYATKIGDCKRIIESTSYTNTEPNMFCINSPTRKMLFELKLIDRYTKIDIDFKNVLDTYDKLLENDVLNYLIEALPTKEVLNYQNILDMMLEDFKMNERSMIGYLDSKLTSLKIFNEAFEKIIDSMSV